MIRENVEHSKMNELNEASRTCITARALGREWCIPHKALVMRTCASYLSFAISPSNCNVGASGEKKGKRVLVFYSIHSVESREASVLITAPFHQSGPGSVPRLVVVCGLSLLLVLIFAPRGFSPGTPVSPSPQKTNTSKFQFDLESVLN